MILIHGNRSLLSRLVLKNVWPYMLGTMWKELWTVPWQYSLDFQGNIALEDNNAKRAREVLLWSALKRTNTPNVQAQ